VTGGIGFTAVKAVAGAAPTRTGAVADRVATAGTTNTKTSKR
jgi:hypothetical protein